MENVIYNELCFRGFNVDVGVVEFCYIGLEDFCMEYIDELDG